MTRHELLVRAAGWVVVLLVVGVLAAASLAHRQELRDRCDGGQASACAELAGGGR